MRTMLAALVFAATLFTSVAHAESDRAFEAVSHEYNVNASPQISSRKFNCTVRSMDQGLVRVVEIRSYITAKSQPDVLIRIVSSNNSVASQIYNGKMEMIAEYTNAEMVNSNLFTFKSGDDKRKVNGRWYMDPDYMMSDFTIADAGGNQLYKETVIYSAKKPGRK